MAHEHDPKPKAAHAQATRPNGFVANGILWALFNAGLFLLVVMTIDAGWIPRMFEKGFNNALVLVAGLVAGIFTRRWRMVLTVVGFAVLLELVRVGAPADHYVFGVTTYKFEPQVFVGRLAAMYLCAGISAALRAALTPDRP